MTKIKPYHRHKPARGISLLETTLAAALLGAAVLTVCGLSASSLRAARLHQDYQKAWDYIERQLAIAELAGVDTLAQSPMTQGAFTSQDGRLWRWTMQIEKANLPRLYDITLTMEWEYGGRPQRVSCQTRLCGKTATVETETEAGS